MNNYNSQNNHKNKTKYQSENGLRETKLSLGIKTLAVFSLILAFAGTALAMMGYIDPEEAGERYAWGENVGFIDFGTEEGVVEVSDIGLSGFAWGENVGWIDLSGVENDGRGNLSGFAWGENVGFIDFSGVEITTNGKFEGQAWGENVGYILFGRENILLATDYVPKQGRGQGGGSRIGTPPPPADDVKTGGGEGGGDEIGRGKDQSYHIERTPNTFFPTATGDVYNEWLWPEAALDMDLFAEAMVNSNGQRQTYYDFNFNIPEDSKILGIEVILNAWNAFASSSGPAFVKTSLSSTGGSTWTGEYTTSSLTTSFGSNIYILGGKSDLWGRSWTAGDFSDSNFRLLLKGEVGFLARINLNALAIRVYYELDGGGQGGGDRL